MVVATADVSVYGKAFGFALNGKIVHVEILQGLVFKGEACACHRLPEVVVNDHSPCAVVELYGVATGSVNFTEEGAVSFGYVVNEVLGVGIELVGILRVVATEQFGKELCWGRNGLFCLDAFLLELLDKQEILDERMAFACNFACKLQRTFSGLLAMELVTVVKFDVLHSAETPHEVEMPVAATEFSVCYIV